MLLIAVVAVVVIVVVALVLMGGGKGQATYPPGGTLPPAGGGTLPPAGGGTVPPAGINFNAPFECTITVPTSSGSMTADIKMEPPMKMWMYTPAQAATQGQAMTVLTSDMRTFYMNMAGQWMKSTSTDNSAMGDFDPAEVQAQYTNPPAGYTYNCRQVGDIPDSQFQLPAGVQPLDLDAMAAGGGADLSGYGY